MEGPNTGVSANFTDSGLGYGWFARDPLGLY